MDTHYLYIELVDGFSGQHRADKRGKTGVAQGVQINERFVGRCFIGLVRLFALQAVKPPRNVLCSGDVAGRATNIQKPMALTATFHNGAFLCLAAILFAYVALQNLHSDIAAVIGHPLFFIGAFAVVVAKVLPKAALGIARTANISNLVVAFQVKAINIKHKTLLVAIGKPQEREYTSYVAGPNPVTTPKDVYSIASASLFTHNFTAKPHRTQVRSGG